MNQILGHVNFTAYDSEERKFITVNLDSIWNRLTDLEKPIPYVKRLENLEQAILGLSERAGRLEAKSQSPRYSDEIRLTSAEQRITELEEVVAQMSTIERANTMDQCIEDLQERVDAHSKRLHNHVDRISQSEARIDSHSERLGRLEASQGTARNNQGGNVVTANIPIDPTPLLNRKCTRCRSEDFRAVTFSTYPTDSETPSFASATTLPLAICLGCKRICALV